VQASLDRAFRFHHGFLGVTMYVDIYPNVPASGPVNVTAARGANGG
jgi:hypothetical protein